MRKMQRCRAVALAGIVAGVLMLPANVVAQTLNGQARAIQVRVTSIFGTTTTTLVDTGTLQGSGDARDATRNTGGVSSLVSAEALHAVTVGWPDQAASEVSLTNVGLLVGVNRIAADVVMASVRAPIGDAASAASLVGNLSINGVPVSITGAPNQTIPIAGGVVLVNEQSVSAAGTTVNALHVIVAGIADVLVASATAGIQ